MAFDDEIIKANYNPVILFEMDITQIQDFWTNYTNGVWFVNFDVNYPNIAAVLLNGVTAQTITSVGSVLAGDIRLNSVSSASDCHDIEDTFYYDAGNNELYVHCPNGYEPYLFVMKLGLVFGYRKNGTEQTYNNFIYEDYGLSIPAMSKSKTSLFFGQVKYEGGTVTLVNTDGNFDNFPEDNEVFGNAARVFLGFEGLDYSEFRKVFSGFVDNITVSTEEMNVEVRDQKKNLQRSIPVNVFDSTTYPNINESNENKVIPILYGQCDNVPVICSNEDATPPVTYVFQICDMSDHDAINAITTVYVNGSSVVPNSTDLTNGQFTITSASGDYSPGDEVTADIKGYEDDDGDLIENGLDIVADLINSYYSVPFNVNFFNTAHWDVIRALDINLFINTPTKLIDAIEDICNSIRCTFIVEDDGRYSARIFQETDAVLQTLDSQDILEPSAIEYQISELISSVEIGYDKDWNEDQYLTLIENSDESTIFDTYKTYRQERFDTLLLNSTDAQTYANFIMDIIGGVQKTIDIRTSYRTVKREIGDILRVTLNRPESPAILECDTEIIGTTKNLDDGTMELKLRIFNVLGQRIYVQGNYWNNTYTNFIYWNTDADIDTTWIITETIQM